jgi:hypothetical protein
MPSAVERQPRVSIGSSVAIAARVVLHWRWLRASPLSRVKSRIAFLQQLRMESILTTTRYYPNPLPSPLHESPPLPRWMASATFLVPGQVHALGELLSLSVVSLSKYPHRDAQISMQPQACSSDVSAFLRHHAVRHHPHPSIRLDARRQRVTPLSGGGAPALWVQVSPSSFENHGFGLCFDRRRTRSEPRATVLR